VADFDVEVVNLDFIAYSSSSIWTDPALPEDPTRLNPRGHVQHRHTKFVIAPDSTLQVVFQAIADGVHGPEDADLGGRLFGWSMGIWPAGAPVPAIVSPIAGRTSRAQVGLKGRYPGHWVVTCARPGGGHICYPFDVENP
jgi:hypothetical protein